MINTLLFDFDGTLAPNLDLPGMRRDVLALTESIGVPEAVYAGRYIVEIIDAASAWLQQQGHPQAHSYPRAAHALITDIEMRAAAQTEPFPGIPEYLAALRCDGIRMAVVTRNCRAAVLQTFPQLLDHVHVLFARDDVTHLKPDVRHLQAALEALGHAGGQAPEAATAAIVGDGGLDMRSGRALGLYCVGVLSGSADAETLKQHGADVILDHCLAYHPGDSGQGGTPPIN